MLATNECEGKIVFRERSWKTLNAAATEILVDRVEVASARAIRRAEVAVSRGSLPLSVAEMIAREANNWTYFISGPDYNTVQEVFDNAYMLQVTEEYRGGSTGRARVIRPKVKNGG